MTQLQHERPTALGRPPTYRRRRTPLRGVAVLVALLLLAVAGLRLLLPGSGNPFGHRTVDRSGPALMLALADLSEYHAAQGQFQILVDLERDTKWVPSYLSGDHVTFLAMGTVDATVDFTGLTKDAVRVSDGRRSVSITLPRPRLADAVVDPTQSRVLNRDRGALDRIGGMFVDNPTSERRLYSAAEQKLSAAARQSDLQQRAQTNTRDMLTALTRSLGFDQVTVTYAAV
jgi:hypothetical protein